MDLWCFDWSLTRCCPCESSLSSGSGARTGGLEPAGVRPVPGPRRAHMEARRCGRRRPGPSPAAGETKLAGTGAGRGTSRRSMRTPDCRCCWCWRPTSPGGGRRPAPRSSSSWWTGGPCPCCCGRTEDDSEFNWTRERYCLRVGWCIKRLCVFFLPLLRILLQSHYFPLCLAVPDVADVGKQHGEVSQAQSLLLGRQAQLGNGPDQSIDHRVQQTQQLGPALQLLGGLRGVRTQICNTEHGNMSTGDLHPRRIKYWVDIDLLLIDLLLYSTHSFPDLS